ncbi:hypothetical protein C8J56DRAFT_855817 [Mycena floridula]|nr:hypothetical protein C8J56DRAFT_855817 [Mycena floridula]
MSERPKRTIRTVVRSLPAPAPKSTPAKRKAAEVDQLDVLLHDSQSRLTSIDIIADLINANVWGMLSEDSKRELAKLLPPTSFVDFVPSLDESHPAAGPSTEPAQSSSFSPDLLDPSVFSDPHFLAAAHTYQDQLQAGFMKESHASKVKKFQDGVLEGTLSAPWKDDVWIRDNPASFEPVPEASSRASDTSSVKLQSILQVGDILAYKRHFSNLNLIVEKDVIIQSINSKNNTLTVLLESRTTLKSLPLHLIRRNPGDPCPPTQSMTISSPTMLENGVLDVDGRIDRTKRPNGNAWKSFTVFRWRDEDQGHMMTDDRGGRESHGTLFYLRSSYSNQPH